MKNTVQVLALLMLSCIAFADPEPDSPGQKLYTVYCSQCHGLEGDGFGVNAADMDILPKDHTDTDEMVSRTDEDLFKAIKFGGKAVGKSILMPNWDGNMTDAEIDALVAYLRVLCCEEAD
ncbi:c-type cytochrome [Aliamphritea hakodatensis]|uniref:c-type cytochrome n=1 Tax=Aliamphritea hakodatensis TaxID=2895352 RepID=UPI0022FD4956|nr:cytochrome c [Aliamphritea hakodatensis]